ncbi:uncharacterized protein C12orf56-like isoform X2 [Physella acuta]|uniref:uncharacterized protein C12orf56-like isoform X2 n=1 Tax=Physella acuta TaxID=109671 RepID=UPI0027DC5880|nr:uncharacterized protein C12orf56-like isoform X2 [Physella acuta]
MAWGLGNVELFKKNSKFESFLKRCLSEQEFERIRGYESCVVVSEKENKAFRFIVLSDEKIYLTENPPKTIEEAVHLKDIVSVELVNEFPEFLRGNERNNAQHIAITYMTFVPRRRSLRNKSKGSQRGSVVSLSTDRSNASTPIGYDNPLDSSAPEDQGYLTQSSASLPTSLPTSRPTSRDSTKPSALQNKKKKKTPGLNDSLDHESILRSLKEEKEEEMMETIDEQNMPTNRSTNTEHSRTKPPPQGRQQTRTDSINSTAQTPLYTQQKNGVSDKQILLHTQSQQHTQDKKVNKTACCFLFGCYRTQKNQVVPASKSGTIPDKRQSVELSSQMYSQQNTNSNNLYGNSLAQLSGFPTASRSSSLIGSRSGTPMLDTERNINHLNMSTSDLGSYISFNGLNTLSVDGLPVPRRCVLNVYILNQTSPLLILLKSAWHNYIIKSTLALEPETLEISTNPKILSASNREKVEHEYLQLKRRLLQPNLSMEDQFVYIDQLYNATKSSFIIKKLFWKHSDLFALLVTELKKYVPCSKSSLTSEEGKIQRADEMEFSILVLSTLNLMFRETEIVPSRLHTLKLEGGKHLSDLLNIVVSQPDLPYQPLSRHWSTPAVGAKGTDVKRNVNEELVRLKTEYTKTAICSLFELFMVAKQAAGDELEILSVSGMIGACTKLKATEKFVDRLVTQIMELVSLSRFELLTPTQSMFVFQMFTLLLTFVEVNKSVISYVRNNYFEEFKYFIQTPAVSRKLPPQYPITATTINIIDQVVTKILGTH